MSDLARDSRLAVRLLCRNPVFASIVILTLGLGIGADTAIFSVVKATLLDPLPYAKPHRLTHILLYDPEQSDNLTEVSYPDFRDWRAEAQSLAGLAAVPTSLGRVFLERDGSLQPVRGLAVSANLFEVLGVAPLIGRALVPEDDRRGAEPVAVIGHGLWRRAFGAGGSGNGDTGGVNPSRVISCRVDHPSITVYRSPITDHRSPTFEPLLQPRVPLHPLTGGKVRQL